MSQLPPEGLKFLPSTGYEPEHSVPKWFPYPPKVLVDVQVVEIMTGTQAESIAVMLYRDHIVVSVDDERTVPITYFSRVRDV